MQIVRHGALLAPRGAMGAPRGAIVRRCGNDYAVKGTARFTVTTNATAPVEPGGVTTFTVTFTPTTSGTKTAALHLANNDPDENPIDLALTARVLSPTEDTDGEGVNDATEFKLAALGFDWQVAPPALVTTFLADTSLSTQTQIDASRMAGQADVTSAPGVFNLLLLGNRFCARRTGNGQNGDGRRGVRVSEFPASLLRNPFAE